MLRVLSSNHARRSIDGCNATSAPVRRRLTSSVGTSQMPARRIGDVYELPEHDGRCFFMQHVDTDSSQLGSQVVRVFEGVEKGKSLTLKEIVRQPTHFFIHVLLRAGETLKLWHKIGRAAVVVEIGELTWRICPADELRQPNATEWYVWRTNGERRKALPGSDSLHGTEFGMAMAPAAVVERAHTGKWTFRYPDFERH